METQKERAKQIITKSLETTSKFDMFNKLVNLYDTLSPGNDKQLVEYMLNELGYTHSISGAWVLLEIERKKLREQERMFPGLFN